MLPQSGLGSPICRHGLRSSPLPPSADGGPAVGGAEDEMVEQLDAQHLGGIGHPLGIGPILGAGGWIAARVGVKERHACGTAKQGIP